MNSIYQYLNYMGSSLRREHYFSRIFIPVMTTILFIFFQTSCKKLVEVNPPITSITGASVYSSDATATAVLTGIYTNLSSSGNRGFTTLSLFAALSADELILFSQTNITYTLYYKNALSASTNGSEIWGFIYPYIFTCNSAIEGLDNSNSLTPGVKQQLLGEAKFMRAFFYFYLINLYGDVPLLLNTDYKINGFLPRAPKSQVYQQIIADLKDAQGLLTNGYVNGSVINSTTERVRPNKWAATALLAKVYLFTGDWVNAEAQANDVVNNSSLYSLTTLNNVFLKNSNEAIWQLQPVLTGYNTLDAALFFIIPPTGPSNNYPFYLSNNLINSFETGDQRKFNWIGKYTDTTVSPRKDYYYPFKYKVNASNAPVTEYLMILRLGEQYLISAEARAQQGNISSAQSDLNKIRNRAGLPNTTANDKTSLLKAILNERQIELFTELGQRWLDLKRTGTVDAVMSLVTAQKGGAWNTNWQWYPIPVADILLAPNLTQNTGY